MSGARYMTLYQLDLPANVFLGLSCENEDSKWISQGLPRESVENDPFGNNTASKCAWKLNLEMYQVMWAVL
jgi:hypothetical protein